MHKHLCLFTATWLVCTAVMAQRTPLPLNPLWHGTWVNVSDPREIIVITQKRFTLRDQGVKARDFQWVGNRGEFERMLEFKPRSAGKHPNRAGTGAGVKVSSTHDFSGYSIFNGQPMTINVPVNFGAQLEAARQSSGPGGSASLVATVQRAEQAMNSLKPGTYRMVGLVDGRRLDDDCGVVASLITDGLRLYREWPCESAGLEMFAASRVYRRKP